MKKNVTYEVCPHCGEEVELENTLGVHTCPNCGKAIVSCSMCPTTDLNDGKNYCSNCCLCKQAELLNKEIEKDNSIYNEFIESIGDLIIPLDDMEYNSEIGLSKAVMCVCQNKKLVICYVIGSVTYQDTLDINKCDKDLIARILKKIADKKYYYTLLSLCAYSPKSLGNGTDNVKRLYLDDDFYLEEEGGYLNEIAFINTTTDEVVVSILMADKSINVKQMRFIELSKDVIDYLLETFDTAEEKTYHFSGSVNVRINMARGTGRTKAEAMRNAMETVEENLTLYGETDTQIDQIEDIEIISRM